MYLFMIEQTKFKISTGSVSYPRNQILLFEPFRYENHTFYILKHTDFEVHRQELYQLNDQK